MSLLVFDFGAIRMEAKYIQLRGNTYYFRRRVPGDVRGRYPDRPNHLFFSLKTTAKRDAVRLAHKHALQQDALWRNYRSNPNTVGSNEHDAAIAYLDGFDLKPGQYLEYDKHDIEPDRFLENLRYLADAGEHEPSVRRENLPEYAALAADYFYGKKIVPRLTEALVLYEELSGSRQASKTLTGRQNAINRLLDIAGDLPIDEYTRAHAREFVDKQLNSGNKTTTVRRYINYVSPIFSLAIREYELEKQNVFLGLVIPDLGLDSNTRPVFSLEELEKISLECRRNDDSNRWAIALASDTGMRTAEIAGLRVEDLQLAGDIPCVRIQRHSSRRLKSKSSNRTIPLVGMSLWAADRIVSHASGKFAFPQYSNDEKCKSTSASAAYNKWIRSIGIDKTMHSFRHSIRDRLRNVGTPSDVADRIGGWSTKSIGEKYGDGHNLTILNEWMQKIVLD